MILVTPGFNKLTQSQLRRIGGGYTHSMCIARWGWQHLGHHNDARHVSVCLHGNCLVLGQIVHCQLWPAATYIPPDLRNSRFSNHMPDQTHVQPLHVDPVLRQDQEFMLCEQGKSQMQAVEGKPDRGLPRGLWIAPAECTTGSAHSCADRLSSVECVTTTPARI